MKYLLALSICLSTILYSFTNYAPESSMSIQIKEKITAFAEAIEHYDTKSLDVLLHHDFRVIANQYPTEDKLTLLTKESYISLMESKKIGGAKYEVKFDYISVEGHSATVITKFEGEESNMYLTLLLIQSEGDWQIIEDMARFQ